MLYSFDRLLNNSHLIYNENYSFIEYNIFIFKKETVIDIRVIARKFKEKFKKFNLSYTSGPKSQYLKFIF